MINKSDKYLLTIIIIVAIVSLLIYAIGHFINDSFMIYFGWDIGLVICFFLGIYFLYYIWFKKVEQG